MRAIVITKSGGPENMTLQNIAQPTPKTDHVIIDIKAFGLNRAELYFRAGLWGDVPKITGIECVGVVHSDPGGRLSPGQKVIAMMGGMARAMNGSYAEMIRVPYGSVVAIETDLPWPDLAAIPLSYATAWACLHSNLALETGQTLLIRGATSALGQAAVNIATEMGARVIATTRNPARFKDIEALRALPMGEAPDLSQRIRKGHPGGIDAVLDIIGNSTLIDSLAAVHHTGRVCLAGFLGGAAPVAGFDPLTQMPSGVQLSFFGSAFVFGTPDYPLSRIPFQSIIDQVAAGKYRAKPARIFQLEEIPIAHELMEAGAATGKFVVANAA
jgi:NADPH:quinone reductase-like Zn-dependent oxidoreductase